MQYLSNEADHHYISKDDLTELIDLEQQRLLVLKQTESIYALKKTLNFIIKQVKE